jgi:hypothetical protein
MARTCDCDSQQNLSLNGFSCFVDAYFSKYHWWVSQKVTNYMIIYLSLSYATEGNFMEVDSLWELPFIFVDRWLLYVIFGYKFLSILLFRLLVIRIINVNKSLWNPPIRRSQWQLNEIKYWMLILGSIHRKREHKDQNN